MKRKQASSLTISTVGAIVFACAIVGALIATKFASLSGMTHLTFNSYALISIVSAVGTFIILLRIIIGNSHSEETGWFIFVLLGQVLFAGSEALQRCSTDHSAVIFWAHMSGAGASLLGIGVFLFAIAYTRPSRSRPALLAPILLWGTVIITSFYAEGNLLFNSNPAQLKHFPWGFNNDAGTAFWISLIWVVVPGIISGLLLLRFRFRSDNPLLRKQSLLFAIAILAPMLIGTITDGIFPILHVNNIPPLATLFELITCVVIFYGTSRYQFFQINPAVLAENVLTTMNEAVIVTRADFTVEYVNAEAERLLQISGKNLSRLSIPTFFSPDSWPKLHAYIQGEPSSGGEIGDVTLVDQQGKQTPVRTSISSLKEGNYQAYVFVLSDISDLVDSYNRLESDANRIRGLLDEAHQLEEQLKAEKDNVEHTVEVRTEELRKAQSELKESDKLKTEFIMLGSHNLRTPITIMANSLEMLKETQDEQARRTYVTSLEQGINRLKDFVEDMVTIVSLEAGTGQRREPVRIVDLLDPVITETKALATTKPAVAFQVDIADDEATILANSVWLRGALRNLLSNAFKFTETGSVTLRSQVADNRYVIEVTDTGIGIAADEVPKLFTKFHRGTDTITFQYEGKGIGLYLTKLIVDEHNGTISAESTLGSGSTFTISLPLSGSESPTPGHKTPTA